MAIYKTDIGFIFMLILLVFIFYIAYRLTVNRKNKQQEDIYRKLWKKHYGLEIEKKKTIKKKGR